MTVKSVDSDDSTLTGPRSSLVEAASQQLNTTREPDRRGQLTRGGIIAFEDNRTVLGTDNNGHTLPIIPRTTHDAVMRSQSAQSSTNQSELHVRSLLAEGDREYSRKRGPSNKPGQGIVVRAPPLWSLLWLLLPSMREGVRSSLPACLPQPSAHRSCCFVVPYPSRQLQEYPRAHSMSAIAAGYRISRRPRVLDRLQSSVL
jgi:hypothetical protein